MNYPYIEKIEKASAVSLKETLYQKYRNSLEMLQNSYIFGTGLLGEYVYRELKKNGIEIQGFIDNDIKKQGQMMYGINIHDISEINKANTIVIASLMYWYEMKSQLEELGFKKFICYEEMALALPQFSNYNQSFYNFFEGIEKQKECYREVLEHFEDEKSKQILDAITAFRLTLDVAHTKRAYDLSVVDGNQYFDRNILDSNPEEIFIDGGGFDGDSIKDFVTWNKGMYKKILFFEPDKNMVSKAKENLKNIENIEFSPKALGASSGTIRYDASGNQTGGGQIKTSGDAVVEIVTIDSLQEDITLLKLDTEGYEMEILKGAENTIQRCKPRIVLAVYHKIGDIYDIWNYIKKLNPSYKVYMRHYTKVYADTVLYFI